MEQKNEATWIIMIFLLVAGIFILNKKDTYTGFYYSNPNDLTRHIQSEELKTIDACRNWIEDQSTIYNADGSAFDYECGKNCDLSGGEPYICEETLE